MLENENISGGRSHGKKALISRGKVIDALLVENECIMNWYPNDEGHLFVLDFKKTDEKIEKQFGKKPYNIYHKVHLFYDFVEETLNKKSDQ